jgi:hypothetical protein
MKNVNILLTSARLGKIEEGRLYLLWIKERLQNLLSAKIIT